MLILRQSTAIDIRMGVFVDATDGVSPETGITLGAADQAEVLKENGAATVAMGGTFAAVTGCDGWYDYTVATGDVDTVGEVVFVVQDSSVCLPVYVRGFVVEEAVYDALYDSGALGPVTLNPTAVSNLEDQYDTTGLSGDTFPATQSQVGSLSVGSGGISTTAGSFTATTAGTPTNSVTDTVSENLVYHIVPPTGGALDVYYEFDIGGSGIIQSVEWVGYVQGNNDNCEVYFYNWAGAAFEQVGTIAGSAGTTPVTSQFVATIAHVGTGANLGLVRFRFASDGGDVVTNVATDRILATYTFSSQSIGYEGGAVWLDTNASNTGTESFVDGTADNPVSTITAARTLLDNLNLRVIQVLPGSSFTLSQGWDGYEFLGIEYTLNLGTQACPNTYFMGASIAASTVTGVSIIFEDCIFDNAVTLPPCVLRRSFIGDTTITAGSAGTFYINGCVSRAAGSASPNFDFGSGLNASNLNMRDYSGGVEIENMGAGTGTYNMSLEGNGNLIINANCSATSNISIRGNFTLTNNATGMTITDGARYDVTKIISSGVALNATVAGQVDANAQYWNDTIISTALQTPADVNAAVEAGQVGTDTANLNLGIIYGAAATGTLSTTQCTSDLSGYTDDQLIGRVIIFTSGPADGEATDITDYANASGLLTFTALTLAPENGNTFKIV